MPDHTDHEIVEKARGGDMRAFRLLVERHQSFVYKVAYRFVSASGDAEDITQESFLRLWRNINRYRPEIKLTTWLYKIVANLCLDFLKSKHHRQAKSSMELHEHKGMISGWSADQPLLDEELRTAVEKLTADFSPKQKAVFVLRDLEDLTMQEIAEILSMSPGKVKSNLYYARKKMGELIAVYYQMKKPAKP